MITIFRQAPRTLDQATTHYLLTYYGYLLHHHERSALHAARSKASRPSEGSRAHHVLEMWMDTASPEALSLLKEGLSGCERRLAERLMADHRSEIRFNDCPSCKALAPSPNASHCPCGKRLPRLSYPI